MAITLQNQHALSRPPLHQHSGAGATSVARERLELIEALPLLDATLETDQLAAQQGNDIHRIGDELRRRQMVSGRRVVRLPKREPEVPSLCSPPDQ